MSKTQAETSTILLSAVADNQPKMSCKNSLLKTNKQKRDIFHPSGLVSISSGFVENKS